MIRDSREEEPNGWCLGEWSTPHNRIEIPASLVNTAYFYHVTCIMADVAGILNKKNDEHHLRTLAETIRKNFNAAFYNEATHHYGEGKQGADVFALAFGLVRMVSGRKCSQLYSDIWKRSIITLIQVYLPLHFYCRC